MTEVVLDVNQKKIPLNDMMQAMLSNIILGYLKAAKDMPKEIKTIKVDIKL